jgi:hypothetical protein
MRKFTLTTLILLIAFIGSINVASAQDFLPTLSDNYMGINQALLQPAAIADSRSSLDIHIIGFNNTIFNDFVRFKTKGIFQIRAMFMDPDWWNKNSSIEAANGKVKNGLISQDILGPGFMIGIGNKYAVGFTTRFRNIINADNIDEPLARSMYTEYTEQAQWEAWHHGTDFKASEQIFADYGLTFAAQVFDMGAHYLKAGITVKLLQGMSAVYFGANDLYYYFHEPGTDPNNNDAEMASWNTPEARFGVSDNWGHYNDAGDFKFDYKFKYTAKPSIGLDLGLVYEWRPNWKEYRYNTANDSNLTRPDENKYFLKIGISVLDIGRLRYTKAYNSADFAAQFTEEYPNVTPNSSNTNWMYLDPVSMPTPPYPAFSDTIHNRYADGSTTMLTDNSNEFLMKLPTAFSFQADVRILKNLYVNLTTFTNLTKSTNPQRSHYTSSYSITPRFELKKIGVSLPIQYTQFHNMNVGLGLRLFCVYVGMNNVFSGLFKNPYDNSFYIGFKIPLINKKPHGIVEKHDSKDNSKK